MRFIAKGLQLTFDELGFKNRQGKDFEFSFSDALQIRAEGV